MKYYGPVRLSERPLSLSRYAIKPAAHQEIGVAALIENPYFFLADGMGAGKTMQTINAAQELFVSGVIDKVVVICPTYVREVWFDKEIGELQKWLWEGLPCIIHECHQKVKTWTHGPIMPSHSLTWMITNYEFMRSKARLNQMLSMCDKKTLLVLDESSYVKTHDAAQTIAALTLRKVCGRVILLNGTPLSERIIDGYSQGNILHPSIFDVKSYYHFRARYCVLGGYNAKQIIGYKNIDDFTRRLAPYILMRVTRECFDLPEALPPVSYSVPMTDKTWGMYKEMRDEMVAWLETGVSATQHAFTKVMRLAQITSGFIGGVEMQADLDAPPTQALPRQEVIEIGSEKLDFFDRLYDDLLYADKNLKLLVWCRHMPEMKRLALHMAEKVRGKAEIGCIAGEPIFYRNVEEERSVAKKLLHPETAPSGPVIVFGTYGTGAYGINLTACHTVVNMSIDYSHSKAQQSAARVDRPGQTHPVSYIDIVATGPQGQKTIDHVVARMVRAKHDVIEATTSAWIQAIREE